MSDKNKKIEIDINDIVGMTYYKIASWNNEEGSPKQKQDWLKLLSFEIVESCMEEFSRSMGIDSGSKVKKPKEYIEYLDKQKNKKNKKGFMGLFKGKSKQ